MPVSTMTVPGSWQHRRRQSKAAAGPFLMNALLHAPAASAPPLRPPAADKERQRGIIIGRGGSALKQLGTAARAEVEEFLGRPVFLSMSVKVRVREPCSAWRRAAKAMLTSRVVLEAPGVPCSLLPRDQSAATRHPLRSPCLPPSSSSGARGLAQERVRAGAAGLLRPPRWHRNR